MNFWHWRQALRKCSAESPSEGEGCRNPLWFGRETLLAGCCERVYSPAMVKWNPIHRNRPPEILWIHQRKKPAQVSELCGLLFGTTDRNRTCI